MTNKIYNWLVEETDTADVVQSGDPTIKDRNKKQKLFKREKDKESEESLK